MQMLKTTLFVALCFLGLFTAVQAQPDSFGSPPPTHDLVVVELLVEANAVNPGEPFWVALKLTMKDEWHVNWVNPGDAGLAPTVTWELPTGWSADRLRWPYPTKYDIAEMSLFGYDGQVYLLAEITPPGNLEGDHTVVTARVDWLACAEACVPGQSVAKASVPHGAPAVGDRVEPGIFERARKALPVVNKQWRFTASIEGDYLSILAMAPMGDKTRLKQVTFFPVDQGVIENASKQILTRDGGYYHLRVERSKTSQKRPTRIRGVLVSETGWGGEHKAIAVNVPVR